MEKFGTAIAVTLTVLVAIAAAVALGGFAMMLTLGALWGFFGILAPLGFWESSILYVLFAVLFALFSPHTSATIRRAGE